MFKRLRLPLCLSFGSGGGPRFRTDVVVTASGKESRNQGWQFERLEYECHYDRTLSDGSDNITADGTIRIDYRLMHSFFRIMAGMAHSFLARDPLDYSAAVGEGLFIDAEGSPAGMQMVKRVTLGAYTADIVVTKPVNGTIVLVGGGTVDYDTGIVEDGAPTGWSGQYDKHVRFDTDKIKPAIVNKSNRDGYIVAWEALPIIEVKGE
jgi:uncharacterized protein (TIGR02217 family)